MLLLIFLFIWGTISIAQHPLKLELVKDINPYGDSQPLRILKMGDSIFFSATDGVHGRELWVSDGTTAGTQMLLDVNPGSGSGITKGLYHDLRKTDNKVFFIGDDGIHGHELWVSNGTITGTFMVKNINTGSQPYTNFNDMTIIRFLASTSNKIYFTANDGVHGYELWVSNGTDTGTYMIKDINPVAFDVHNLPKTDAVICNNLLYFNATDSVHGFELWVTDGTEMGTHLVKDINPGTADSYLNNFYEYNGRLLFGAFDSLGQGLWLSDGTFTGTKLIKYMNYLGDYFHEYNSKLYFAGDGMYGWELWVTDGSAQGTQIFKKLDPNGPSDPSRFMEFEGDLFFTATTTPYGRELWSTDGTLGGTQLFIDFNTNLLDPLFGGTRPSYLVTVFKFKNYLILNGDHGMGRGSELWVMDEDKDSIMHINYDYKTISPAQNIYYGVELSGSMYFISQYDSALGIELWRMYDSTAVGIEENKPLEQANIKAYPNPNTGNFITLELNEVFEGTIQMEMLDLSGKLVNRFELNQTNNQPIQISTKNLKQGVYFMKVSGENYEETVRFVKL